MSAKKPKLWRCSCGDFESTDLTAFVAHERTHLKPVTTEPTPMYYYVEDGIIVGTALDLEEALARRSEFPRARWIHHLAWKRQKRRERNLGGGASAVER